MLGFSEEYTRSLIVSGQLDSPAKLSVVYCFKEQSTEMTRSGQSFDAEQNQQSWVRNKIRRKEEDD